MLCVYISNTQYCNTLKKNLAFSDGLGETRISMVLFAPFIHRVELPVGLVDDLRRKGLHLYFSFILRTFIVIVHVELLDASKSTSNRSETNFLNNKREILSVACGIQALEGSALSRAQY